MLAFRSDWAAWARDRLPPAILILALASLFAFGGDLGYFKRSAVHSENSSKNLAIALNLSPSENFRLFKARRLDLDGSPRYVLYGRFPIGGTALIKLATSPFNSLSAKMVAARTLAALMFCGAVVFAYLAIARLAGCRWVALAAALIAFSSYYALYYSDEVSNESAMDIFGVMLTFHGMAVFVQEGRFRQLVVKSCVALLVGWHVYALLLAFIVFGLAREVIPYLRRRSDSSDDSSARNYDVSLFSALVSSRHVALGAIALVFGIAVLGANLVGELRAYEGGDARERLPSWQSALRRTVGDTPPDWDWRLFASRQFLRAGGAVLPYALPWKRGYPEPESPPALWVVFGGLAAGGALAGAALLARRHRALWAALALFGFFWALPVRNNAFSEWRDFEAVFYVGVPLALFAPALIRAREWWGTRSVAAAALGAAVVFAVSVFQMGNLDEDSETAATQRAEMADYDIIREKTRGKVVAVSLEITGGELVNSDILEYYLAGSVLAESEKGPTYPQMGAADFVISRHREYRGFEPLTPENREVFLYAVPPAPGWHRAERRRIESGGELAARSGFDLYLDGGSIHYIKSPCAERDRMGRFFLSVHPVNIADLPADRRDIGHDGLNTEFVERGTPVFDNACMMKRPLPDYPIRAIETGQWLPGDEIGTLWRAVMQPPLSRQSVRHYNAMYESARASGEPLIRADFDVYMQDNALIYTREPCAEDDARGRFFLSVHPADAADLPAHRRAIGHDDLNFNFSPNGVVFGDRCMVRRELPDYPIKTIETGQWLPGGGTLWRAAIISPPNAESVARYEAIYESARASGEPLIRSDFDVYMQDNALIYTREPCAADDARGRFFLSVHPARVSDLPESRRALGHDSLNFDFSPDGVVFNGKCMVRRELPDYEIDKIVTGQDAPGGERLWMGEAAVGER